MESKTPLEQMEALSNLLEVQLALVSQNAELKRALHLATQTPDDDLTLKQLKYWEDLIEKPAARSLIGYAIVLLEPTKEMIRAFENMEHWRSIEEIYKAMIKAANKEGE